MENKNGKFTITSTTRALKLSKQLFVLCLLLWGSGFVFSAHLALSNFSDYSVMKTKFMTEVKEIKKEQEEVKKGKAVTDKDGNIRIIEYDSYYYKYLLSNLKEPDLYDDTHFYLYLFFSNFFIFFLTLLFCSYRAEINESKNFLEFDGETGEVRFVENLIFNTARERSRVFDVIKGPDIFQGIYCKKLNVGKLTIHGKYLLDNKVYEEEWTLRFCDNIKESAEKVNKFIQKHGKGAVKINIK